MLFFTYLAILREVFHADEQVAQVLLAWKEASKVFQARNATVACWS